MMTDNVFGPDRDGPPGITPVPGHAMPAQFTDFMVESMAIHSRSRGWLPGIVIRIATDDGAGIVGCMETTKVDELVDSFLMAAERAIVDVRVGVADGTLPDG